MFVRPEPQTSRKRPSCPRANVLTVTFHALVDESVQQRPAVVAERGAGVSVDLKLMLAPGVLRPREADKRGQCQCGVPAFTLH